MNIFSPKLFVLIKSRVLSEVSNLRDTTVKKILNTVNKYNNCSTIREVVENSFGQAVTINVTVLGHDVIYRRTKHLLQVKINL